MSLLSFYEAVLPAEGRYCLFLADQTKHVWASSHAELVELTENAGDSSGIYFATASFKSSASRTADNAHSRRTLCFDIDAGADKTAKHGDAVYPTQRDALRAVLTWVSECGVKPGYVVSSGEGLHVYIILDRDYTLAEWKPVADLVKAAVLAQGLRIDAAVTADMARVLRPVGTLHKNGQRVAALASSSSRYSLEQLKDIFAPLVPQQAPTRSPVRRSINADVLDAPVGPPRSVEKIREHCNAMAYAMDRRGVVPEPYWRAMLGVIKYTKEGEEAAHHYSAGHQQYSYDETQDKLDRWTVGPTTCAVFESENPAACQSCKHRGQIKSPILLGSVVGAAPERPAPPAETMEQDSVESDSLDGAWADDDEAPTTSVTAEPASSAWAPFMPEGFAIKRGPAGYIMTQKRLVDQDDPATGNKIKVEVEVPFSTVPFWFDSWAPGLNDADQASAVFRVYDSSNKKTTSYNLPTRVLSKRDTLLTALASQNIQAFSREYPTLAKVAMEDFVKESLERIRDRGQRQRVTERFGTMYNHRRELIVAQGAHIITKEGVIYEGVLQEKLKQRAAAYRVSLPDSVTGRWEPGVWDAHIGPRAKRHIEYLQEFYSDPNFRPYQLAIMLAWASPLLAFVQGTYHPESPLPGIGLTVSLFSTRSGTGKTAAMHAAALAFGVPNAMVLQLDATTATDNARQGVLLQSGTLPSFMDEMENVAAADLASLISAVGNGASKLRMTKDTALTGGVTTALVNLMSTNKSHRELAAADRTESNAVQMRLLEIDCSSVQEVARERALQETQARSQLLECAGAVGAMLHRRMCEIGGPALNAAGVECADKARGMLEGQQDGRFLWRAFGAVLLLRRILGPLGLKVFELDDLAAEFKKWHDAGYEFASERIMPSAGPELMSMFLSSIQHQTVVTPTETQRFGGDLRTPGDSVLNDRMPDNAVARSVLSNGGYVYVRTDTLRDWCHRNKVSHQAMITKCRNAGIFEPLDITKPNRLTRQVDLYKGTRMAQGIRCSVFKILVPRLTGALPDTVDMTNVVAFNPKEAAVSDAAQEGAVNGN